MLLGVCILPGPLGATTKLGATPSNATYLRAALPFANWRGVANAIHVVDRSSPGLHRPAGVDV